ncbi:MAG: hypothetical protein QOE23_1977 [Pseudonocardiales bacterium]|jgi:hypothetical protein|nr:hypothetical protein [Pseudonocardiales bacterium]
MNPRTEERLRAAFDAKADQVTEERLDRLAAQRRQALLEGGDGGADWAPAEAPAGLALFDDHADAGDLTPLDLDHRANGARHARWLAPVLAAAAVVAVALGVTAVSSVANHGKHSPNPPATQAASPSPSVPTSAPAPAPTPPTAVVAPPYLPRGQQGSRSQVPWSAVGSGWRLLLPYNAGDPSPASLYLYDPAGGRYLISDRLPANTLLVAWSPDGARAMVRSISNDETRYQEVSLRSGELSTGFTTRASSFVSYTQPKGLAVLLQQTVDGVERLVRYSTAGHLLHSYAADLAGHGRLDAASALYLPDGGQFVAAIDRGPLVLVSNAGDLVRAYPLPDGYANCVPVKWWIGTSVLERCSQLTGPSEVDALYLQPVSGGSPTVLTTGAGQYQMGYWNAWPLSNGHTLLQNTVGCGSGSYDILLENGGATRPLRIPAGLAADTPIVHIDADLVTFGQRVSTDCRSGVEPHYVLFDYNLVTGAFSKLRDGGAMMASWPGTKP